MLINELIKLTFGSYVIGIQIILLRFIADGLTAAVERSEAELNSHLRKLHPGNGSDFLRIADVIHLGKVVA